MYLSSGPMPVHKSFRHAVTGKARTCRYLAIALTALVAVPVFAQPQIPLTLAEAEDRALLAEPGQQALIARATALSNRSVVAGELPDPTLRVGLNNFPIQSGGFTTEGMTHAAVAFRQAFPAGDSRKISTRRYERLAGEMQQQAQARGRNILTATRDAWLELFYWQQAHQLVLTSRPFFDDLATVTRSLYAVGRKSQQDVLRAELELSRLDDRVIDIERQKSRAEAALSKWIGDQASRPIANKLPRWQEVPELPIMQAALQQHPLMLAADAQIEARAADVELANERSKPNWALDVGYSYRDGSLPTGEPRSDFITVGVTVGLPVFRKKSVDGNLSAALQEKSAARMDREQTLRGLSSQLNSEYSRWHDLTRRLSLYEARILNQANGNAEASLLAYQNDRSDFANVMLAYIDNLNTRTEHIRLQVERAQSYAVLANLGGISR